jgi:hypothetical protein
MDDTIHTTAHQAVSQTNVLTRTEKSQGGHVKEGEALLATHSGRESGQRDREGQTTGREAAEVYQI